MPAVVSGEVDYLTGVGPIVGAAITGVPVRLVAAYVPTLPIMLVARPEFKSVMDLKGKGINFGVIGSGPHIVTRLILKHFGLDPDRDVKAISGGPADSRLAALQQGLIAAAVVPPPFDYFAKKLGFNILVRAQDVVTYPEGGLSTTTKKIKERPDEVKRVIEAGIKASRYIRTEREGTIQFLALFESYVMGRFLSCKKKRIAFIFVLADPKRGEQSVGRDHIGTPPGFSDTRIGTGNQRFD